MTRAFFDGGFDRNNIKPPVCSAQGVNPEMMTPDSEAEDPQNDFCSSCPMNKFGTAIMGKGKACSEHIALEVAAGGDLDTVYEYKVPPSSIKKYKNYMKGLGAMPIQMVFTKVTQGDSEYHSPVFKKSGDLPEESLEKVMELMNKTK